MREIKFRGRTSSGYWYYGSLFVNSKGETFIVDRDNGKREQVVPDTVGEFMGRKDKNGVDIYEGDIFGYANPEYNEVVKFGEYDNGFWYEDNESGMGWYVERVNDNSIKTLYPEDVNRLEVIGNIYEDQMKPLTKNK